jgi:SsrA-binding protein
MKNNINIVNRKSKFEYTFIRTEISGIQLTGSEVKSIRDGKVTMTDSFCFFNKHELYLKNVNIYSDGSAYSHEPMRERKLLLKNKELSKLKRELVKGLVVIPYRLFTNERGLIKIEIALSKGKKIFDKRETIKKRDSDREIKILV